MTYWVGRTLSIVQVLDYDVADGCPYIVMELIEGPSLDEYQRALHEAGHTLPGKDPKGLRNL